MQHDMMCYLLKFIQHTALYNSSLILQICLLISILYITVISDCMNNHMQCLTQNILIMNLQSILSCQFSI